MLSLGIEAARALLTASRNRGFMSGSGMPDLAATVSSRLSLEKAAERFLSCAPLRCMMFLNLEWPAMGFQIVRVSEGCAPLQRAGASEQPLPPADIAPLPKLPADLAVDPDRREAHRLVQADAGVVGQGDAGEGGMEALAREHRQQLGIE